MRNTPIPHVPHAGPRILSRTAEHALRASLYLARRRGEGPVPADVVAAALGTPPNYTAKTLRRLTRRGLLTSVRGPRGGFALRVEPREVSLPMLLDAVDDVSEQQAVCLLGDKPCDRHRPCDAHARWTELQEAVNELIDRTTLADLLGDPAATPEAA